MSCSEQAQRVSQRHFAVLVVVAVGFAIGGHVAKLRLGRVAEAALEARGEVLAGVQQALKRDRARAGSIVKKDGHGDAGVEADEVWARGIDAGVGRIGPVCVAIRRCFRVPE